MTRRIRDKFEISQGGFASRHAHSDLLQLELSLQKATERKSRTPSSVSTLARGSSLSSLLAAVGLDDDERQAEEGPGQVSSYREAAPQVGFGPARCSWHTHAPKGSVAVTHAWPRSTRVCSQSIKLCLSDASVLNSWIRSLLTIGSSPTISTHQTNQHYL